MPSPEITRSDAEAAVRTLIAYLGDDPDRPGLRETPARVVRTYDELRAEHEAEFSTTTFATEGDDLVAVRDLPFVTLCEHHLLLVVGVAHVGYVPRALGSPSAAHAGALSTDSPKLGLSKFARIVRKCAAGLTMQETLTRAIASTVSAATFSPDVAVLTSAEHSCMSTRGVRVPHSSTLVSSMLGEFQNDRALRSEFLQLLRLA